MQQTTLYKQFLIEARNPMFWVSVFIGTAFMFAVPWAFAIGCVALGHGPEVCGL